MVMLFMSSALTSAGQPTSTFDIELYYGATSLKCQLCSMFYSKYARALTT